MTYMSFIFFTVMLHVLLGAYGTVVEDSSDALKFLSRFGYVSEDALIGMNLVDATPYIKEFQEMMGINKTGKLDKETLHMMNVPRCGNRDVKITRSKRYTLSDARWEKRDITYRISEFSKRRGLDRALVERDFQKAFQLWQASTNLNFRKIEQGEADIDIQFTTGDHGDENSFDGPGDILAHAFPPGAGRGGDIHFDDHEHWTLDSPEGYNILFVATHEIGHTLGLDHSKVKHSIMAATYSAYRPHLQLHPDDIQGIQTIYGRKESRTFFEVTPGNAPRENYPTIPTTRILPRPRPTSTPRPGINNPEVTTKSTPMFETHARTDLCKDPQIDAITSLPDRSIVIFKGRYVYFLYPDKGLVDENARTIGSVFNGLEDNIDAAFTGSNGYTYIFKGGKYWRFRGFSLSDGYPKSIAERFPGIPNDIDAAFEWPQNKRIYFFKGDKLWAFNRFRRPPVSNRYPLQLAQLNLPSGIDAAFAAPNGRSYLFKGSQYWRLDSSELKVVDAEPPYPKDTRWFWFQCDKNRPAPGEI